MFVFPLRWFELPDGFFMRTDMYFSVDLNTEVAVFGGWCGVCFEFFYCL